MSLSFNFSTKSVHNGYLLTASIYGGYDPVTDMTWPGQNFPTTFYATREEVLAVCQAIVAWSISIEPKKAVKGKDIAVAAKKAKENK